MKTLAVVLCLVLLAPACWAGDGPKKPSTAFALSLFLPAGGQAYNGTPVRLIVLGSCVIGGPVVAYTAGRDKVTHFNASGQWETDKEPNGLFAPAMAVGIVAYVYSLFDAPITARKINERQKVGMIITPKTAALAWSF